MSYAGTKALSEDGRGYHRQRERTSGESDYGTHGNLPF